MSVVRLKSLNVVNAMNFFTMIIKFFGLRILLRDVNDVIARYLRSLWNRVAGSTGSPGRWIPGSLGRWVTECDPVPCLIVVCRVEAGVPRCVGQQRDGRQRAGLSHPALRRRRRLGRRRLADAYGDLRHQHITVGYVAFKDVREPASSYYDGYTRQDTD